MNRVGKVIVFVVLLKGHIKGQVLAQLKILNYEKHIFLLLRKKSS